jgi:hypothetical protein
VTGDAEETTMRHEPASSHGAEARPFPLEPTPIHVSDDVLADLQRRLELTRWPVEMVFPQLTKGWVRAVG